MPSKFLGQHFLKNGAVIEKIIGALAPERGDVIFEIGPGHGELTLPLIARCSPLGAKIIGIEKDEALAKELVDGEIGKHIEVIRGDILKVLPELARSHKNYKLAGNIPYYLTGYLLRTISGLENMPSRCVLMLQKEVAERITAAPPRMNRLAASVQFWADPRIVMGVPKEDFDPMPKVDSAVLVLPRKKMMSDIGAERYYAALHAIFAQPRKTILNNISAEKGKEGMADRLKSIDIDPGCRPQDLGIEQIARVADALWG